MDFSYLSIYVHGMNEMSSLVIVHPIENKSKSQSKPIAINQSKPISIKTIKRAKSVEIGTSRSYDETRVVPTFVRSLTPTPNHQQNSRESLRKMYDDLLGTSQ